MIANRLDRVREHIERAVAMRYRDYRSIGDTEPQAFADACSEVLGQLRQVALKAGCRLDFAEQHSEATDVEFVTVEEFERRPEPIWIKVAVDLTRPGLTPGEAVRLVARYRLITRRRGGVFRSEESEFMRAQRQQYLEQEAS